MHQTTNAYYVEDPLPLLGEKHVPNSGGNLKNSAQDENCENGALGSHVANTGTDTTAPQLEAKGRINPGDVIVS